MFKKNCVLWSQSIGHRYVNQLINLLNYTMFLSIKFVQIFATLSRYHIKYNFNHFHEHNTIIQ